jgi:uncharacterized protein (DUF58 family)
MNWRTNLARPLGLLLLALICFLTAQGTGIRLFLHLFYLTLALLVLSFIWAWLNLRGLRVTREASARRAQVGDIVGERLVIQNLWPFPRLWLELHDHSDLPQHGGGLVTYLPSLARRRWSSRTACTLRGRYTLGPATLASGDPFGIFRLERHFQATNELIVYPRTVALTGFSVPPAELSGGVAVRARGAQVTSSVAGVREYMPGDPFNRIHWRTTARTGQLMVREFELDPTAEVYIVLDMQQRAHWTSEVGPHLRHGGELRGVESTEEYAVQAAASVAQLLLGQRRAVGLIAWGQHREIILPEREDRQVLKLLEALAVLRAHGRRPLAEVLLAESLRFGRNTTLVVITPALDEEWVAGLQELRYRGTRAAAILLDQASFGGRAGADMLQGRLQALHVPCSMLRQGQPLAEALA